MRFSIGEKVEHCDGYTTTVMTVTDYTFVDGVEKFFCSWGPNVEDGDWFYEDDLAEHE